MMSSLLSRDVSLIYEDGLGIDQYFVAVCGDNLRDLSCLQTAMDVNYELILLLLLMQWQ